MKKLISITAVAISLVASTSAQAATNPPMTSQPTKYVLTAHATGDSVSMSANMKTGGAMSGFATARFVIDLKKNTLCYTATSKGLTGIVAAHIHAGAVGKDGGPVITISPTNFNKKTATCVASTPALLGMMATTPANYYFNVHTKKYPDGAVRGQLAAGK